MTARAAAQLVAGLLIAAAVLLVYRAGGNKVRFDNVRGQVVTLQGTAALSRAASDRAGQILQESNHARIEDHRIVAAARAADRLAPVGFWARGVLTMARTPVSRAARSPATVIPSSSTGTGTAR